MPARRNALFPGVIQAMFTAGDAMFQDRRDAGRALAQLVGAVPNLGDAVLLALPRGGVPVAFEVARACSLPLDILAVRKIGAPGQRELAMGAVASGGATVLNPDVLRFVRISEPALNAAIEEEQRKLRPHGSQLARRPFSHRL